MSYKFIDAHFHLDGYKNHKTIYKLINTSQIYTLCVTNSPYIYIACKQNYIETKFVKFALGFHPRLIGKERFDEKGFEKLSENAKYIGEVGLDFSRNYVKTKNEQIRVFKKIINIAVKRNLLVSIHSVNATDELINIIKEYKLSKFILHWFKGTEEQINELSRLGAYFSVNPDQIKEKNILYIPKNRILVETDGPNNKLQKSIYSSSNIRQAYDVISQKLNIADLKQLCYKNFYELISN